METSTDSALAARGSSLYEQLQQRTFQRTDRMFAVLMVVQWLGGIVAALLISPRSWEGAQSAVHPHVWLAAGFGGLLVVLPVYLACRHPGRVLTRHVIAVSQMLFSSLLIHVSGGRIETHFHVFGSLAFLAFYRDWRVLVPATLLVAIDHFVRGLFWPETVFGISAASPWRWLEHAAWVLFEDVFLFISCRQGVSDMRNQAQRTAELERMNAELSSRSIERQEAAAALHRAKDAAEAASRAKSAFLAHMSHEIRTPLNGILGFADVLLRLAPGANDQERRDYLQTIHDSGRHLLGLINDILDLSKIESGQLEIQAVRCAPHSIIAEVVSILRVRAMEKGINLEYRWTSGIPETITTDPSRLRQLLMNLVGNAIKFTERGTVEIVSGVEGAMEEARLRIEVTDTGIGISRDNVARIFEPFAQADESITRRFGGTGLGLAICRELAELLGGKVAVESELGRGSNFGLTIAAGSLAGVQLLEASVADVVPRHHAARSEPLQMLPSASVLLVEDGVTNRKLINLILSRAGARVVTAEDGLAGVQAAVREKFDIILMDMQMPVMDGYTAATELRRRGYTMPIIALTAHAMNGDEERCRQAGCSGYLTKPIDSDRLLQAVAEALGDASRSMHAPATDSAPIGSSLPLDDPEFREIVVEFIEKMREKLGQMHAAQAIEDFDELARLAHWLKGAGGTAGFGALTQPAATLEQLSKQQQRDFIPAALDELQAVADRIELPAALIASAP